MTTHPTDGADLLTTAADYRDAGWGAGFTGEPLAGTLARLARELGPLAGWRADAVAAGHAAGVADAAGYRADMESGADGAGMDGVPF